MFRRSSRSLVLPEMFGSKVPAAPSVMIEDSLGIPPEATGFDFAKFYDLARTIGHTNDEISTHTQYFSGRSPRSYAGRHRGRTATIFIPTALRLVERLARGGPEQIAKEYGVDIYNDLTPAGVINDIAVHEFGHDHGMLHLNERRDTRIHVVRQIAPRLASLGCGAEMMAEIQVPDNRAQALIPLAALAVSAGVALFQDHGPHINDRTEEVAYRVQEQYGRERIVNFDPALLAQLAIART